MQLSPIVAGTSRLHQWGLDTQGLLRWIEQALDLGITSFDHADIYGGYTVEALFGQALAAAPGLRQRLQIVTKCELAHAHAVAPSTVAYAWLLRHPSRPWPVTGSGRVQALREAVAALGLRLSAEDWYRVWQASTGREVA
jgi:predicted oxidoreductase